MTINFLENQNAEHTVTYVRDVCWFDAISMYRGGSVYFLLFDLFLNLGDYKCNVRNVLKLLI